MGERIIGYIDVRKGFYEALLVATDQRFIVGWTWRHGLLWSLLMPWSWLPHAILPIRKAGKLEKLSPDEILNADEDNFAILFTDVVEVRLVPRIRAPNIVIVTSETEHRFKLKRAEFHHFEDHVLPYLTDKVSIR